MWWWNGPHPMWGMGIFPLMGFVFVILVLFAISRLFGGGAGFCGCRRYNEIEDLRREMRELKDEIVKLRRKE
jgi:hypothetical protein